MVNQSDVLIVGAGTAGIYFGWLMAKKGYSVTILDQHARDKVGQRLEVVHFETDQVENLGVLTPKEGMPEFICRQEEGSIITPDMNTIISAKVPHTILKLPLFLQRMYGILETDGVNLEFSCEYITSVFENGKIKGVVGDKGGEKIEYRARIIVDASGTAAVIRTSLPEDYGIETFKLDSNDVMHVPLRYIKWTEPDKPHPSPMLLDLFHIVFLNPSYMDNGAILGTGHPGSFEQANKVLDDFLDCANWPSFEVIKKEQGVVPYRRPLYSLVSDGLLCIGDAAAITRPYAGHGITATWELCRIAADVVEENFQKEDVYLTKKMLWDINVHYFRNQGAQFAAMLTQLSGLVNLTKNEMSYFLKNTAFINLEDMTDDFNLHLTPGQYMKLAGSFMSGIFTRQLSLKNLKNLGQASILADRIRLHYTNFPENPADFMTWKDKAESLWKKKRPVTKEYPSTTITYF